MLEDTLQENDSEDDEDTEIKTPEQEVARRHGGDAQDGADQRNRCTTAERRTCLLYTSDVYKRQPRPSGPAAAIPNWTA